MLPRNEPLSHFGAHFGAHVSFPTSPKSQIKRTGRPPNEMAEPGTVEWKNQPGSTIQCHVSVSLSSKLGIDIDTSTLYFVWSIVTIYTVCIEFYIIRHGKCTPYWQTLSITQNSRDARLPRKRQGDLRLFTASILPIKRIPGFLTFFASECHRERREFRLQPTDPYDRTNSIDTRSELEGPRAGRLIWCGSVILMAFCPR